MQAYIQVGRVHKKSKSFQTCSCTITQSPLAFTSLMTYSKYYPDLYQDGEVSNVQTDSSRVSFGFRRMNEQYRRKRTVGTSDIYFSYEDTHKDMTISDPCLRSALVHSRDAYRLRRRYSSGIAYFINSLPLLCEPWVRKILRETQKAPRSQIVRV